MDSEPLVSVLLSVLMEKIPTSSFISAANVFAQVQSYAPSYNDEVCLIFFFYIIQFVNLSNRACVFI